ncbi:TlpA disulfide reductase family protein [Flectobacillus roseus]|uniref:TlpA disulfide reductase family protein n=1 Tax=Flectobacillus roseus TaxID=502259 RepID=A0ABT6YEF0_9BACT|nr:TlpA disulfide reductase family protein [Flectobacillus roseus]MDI9861964.1 TlpA disulfide reductase family protein [Flectobacillus roseus]
MKKIGNALLWLLLICSSVLGQKQPEQTQRYQISGKIEGLNNRRVFLKSYFHEKEIIDSVFSKDGVFRFQGKMAYPQTVTLYLSPMTDERKIVVQAGNILVKAKAGDLEHAQIQGSSANDDMDIYQEQIKLGRKFAKGVSAVEADSTLTSLEKQRRIYAIFTKVESFYDSVTTEFVKSHPNSMVSAMVIKSRFIQANQEAKARESFEVLTDVVKKSFYGKMIQSYLFENEKVSVGKIAPAFMIKDVIGNPFQLSSLKGKFVLIDFWASWCGPCRQENPNLVQAYQQFKDKDFEIIGVSIDDNTKSWTKAIEVDSLQWTQVCDGNGMEGEVAKRYLISSIPTNFLLDKTGKIIAKNLRGEELKIALEHFIK